MTEHSRPGRELSRAQKTVLAVAAAPMIVFGALGAAGTYTNVMSGFDRSATALGAVAAGEGATLILATLYIGLTMMGQGAPRAVRVGLWSLPMVAAAVGATVAHTVTEAVVYGVTPLAMCTSAEGLGLMARRVVVYRTGVDVAARQQQTETLSKIAYHRARAERHPDAKVRARSAKAVWRLASRLNTDVDPDVTDAALRTAGAWIAHGADTALASVYGAPALPGVTPVTADDTQATQALSRHGDNPPSRPRHGMTLAEVATVTDVPLPVPGAPLSDDQLSLVLRYLRYREDPPMSYRQAADAFRAAGFTAAEDRLRAAWAELVMDEKTERPGGQS